MERFIIRKNTLPYIHQWAVLDSRTGKKVGEYKTKKAAQDACNHFEQYGLSNNIHNAQSNTTNAWNAANERMKHPEGDLPPRHSDKRPIELD